MAEWRSEMYISISNVRSSINPMDDLRMTTPSSVMSSNSAHRPSISSPMVVITHWICTHVPICEHRRDTLMRKVVLCICAKYYILSRKPS